jgi:hypothetical protein
MGVRCGAICLIAQFLALSDQESNQERGASKQLAPQSLCGVICLIALFVALNDLPYRLASLKKSRTSDPQMAMPPSFVAKA